MEEGYESVHKARYALYLLLASIAFSNSMKWHKMNITWGEIAPGLDLRAFLICGDGGKPIIPIFMGMVWWVANISDWHILKYLI